MLKKLNQLNKKIIFTNVLEVAEIYSPKPAYKHIPNWYKDTSNRIPNEKTPDATPTIKKCVPVFDAMTMGYIIVTHVDVYVKQVDGKPAYAIAGERKEFISSHPVMQGSKHPASKDIDFPKWISPWGITTPKGYSVLFCPPMHNPNPWFTCLPGVVDTDSYTAPVNFPFMLNDSSFEGLIPAGTPMVQVIPFKRDKWSIKLGDKKEIEQQAKISAQLSSQFFDRYKRMFWSRKEYK